MRTGLLGAGNGEMTSAPTQQLVFTFFDRGDGQGTALRSARDGPPGVAATGSTTSSPLRSPTLLDAVLADPGYKLEY